MTGFRFLGFWVALLVCAGVPGAAHADPDPVSPGQNDLLVTVEDRDSGAIPSGPGSGIQTVGEVQLPSCKGASPGSRCRPVTLCEPDDTYPSGYALHLYAPERLHGLEYQVLGECEPSADGPSLDAVVLRAFRRIPLPASVINLQPPGGKTLVNLETIFSADDEPFQRSVRLLGRTVRLKIWPSSFAWSFGDAQTRTTTHGGRAYEAGVSMGDYITHQYARTGTVSPSVDTTYSAEFSLDGGRTWTPVDGTVTINGTAASLRVVEARPVLVGAN